MGGVSEAALVELGLVCASEVVGLLVVWVVGKVDEADGAFWVGLRMLMLAALVAVVLRQPAFGSRVLELWEALRWIQVLWRQKS